MTHNPYESTDAVTTTSATTSAIGITRGRLLLASILSVGIAVSLVFIAFVTGLAELQNELAKLIMVALHGSLSTPTGNPGVAFAITVVHFVPSSVVTLVSFVWLMRLFSRSEPDRDS